MLFQTFSTIIQKDTQQAQHLHTDDWLRKMYDKIIVGAVLLDLSATFDIINHISIIVKNVCVIFYTPLL